MEVLKHPSPRSSVNFTLERWRANPEPKVVHIGWWLRRLRAFFELPVSRLGKVMLTPKNPRFREVFADEQKTFGPFPNPERVQLLEYLPPLEYDRVLSQNIAFIELLNTSANNAIVECIARNTPILVNPLPAVVEYLGADYPLYHESPEEAAAKAECPETVAAAYRHLQALDKSWLKDAFFRETFAASAIYRGLPDPA